MSNTPPPRSGFSHDLLLPAVLILTLLLGIGWYLLRPAGDGSRPDRLVEASELAPPTPLPPLVPGILHAGDARRRPEGWWVLDQRSRRVHLLDAELRPLRSLGGHGDAPGEFRTPTALGFLGDSLVVLDGGEAAVLHVFDPDGTLARKDIVHVPGCDAFLASGILEAGVEPLHLLGSCTRLLPAPAMGSVLVRVEEGGGGRIVGGRLPVVTHRLSLETAVGAGMGSTTWVGNSSSPCLEQVVSEARAGESPSLCMAEWVGVRFSIGELAAGMGRGPGAARIAEVLGPMEWLPVMDRVFPHPDGLVLRRLSGLEVRELVLLRPDGSMHPLWSGLPESSWVGGDQVLVAWEGVEGMHMELLPLHPDGLTRNTAR